ncbi:nicotinate phosphoribosyltransferase [Saxibacter everestensis]|uniref:Nicotinate phosphoribosyltransferase n=1 Tax=Saxibacter everestensis TaxID=2909229 RepID=A0ABY8QR43_9MICO|nr:nicotinate phosphoribosyltransferase [Brevibacteriaceae bacterium ZFBP1038]
MGNTSTAAAVPATGRAAASTALLTDQYELTMLDAALRSGAAHRRSLFEVFARRLPDGRRYGVVAGTGRFLEELTRFRFDEAEIDWLRSERIVSEKTLHWLADYRFSGSVSGYAEGEVFFPGSPILLVEGSFAECVILETLALSVLNHDSAVAAAASRMTAAAADRPCIEMGSRRTHEESAVAAARAAVIAGFSSTSNMEAGRRYGLKTGGTAAHSFTLLHDSEEEAFRAQIETFGSGTTLLVDTYDVPRAVDLAIEVAGTDLAGVRLDSGDLLVQARDVRAQLDGLGATNTRITVTSDLDEFAIAGLAAGPVDAYGVGTSLVTGSGAPTAGLVYKLVARHDDNGSWRSVAKASMNKASVGGRKYPVRVLDGDGVAVEEIIGIGSLPALDASYRELLVPLVTDGVIDDSAVGAQGVTAARERHAASRAELPATALKLQRGEPALVSTFQES